jgi:hypothetical protein
MVSSMRLPQPPVWGTAGPGRRRWDDGQQGSIVGPGGVVWHARPSDSHAGADGDRDDARRDLRAVPGTAGREEMGCAILCHGPIAAALPAAFPRVDVALLLAPAQQGALAVVLAAEQLVLCETRRDDRASPCWRAGGSRRNPC